MTAIHLVYMVLALFGVAVLLDRLVLMSRATYLRVRLQHIQLAMSLLWSIFLHAELAAILVVGSMLVFLLLSQKRWSKGGGAIEDTTRPGALGPPITHHH